MIRETCRLLRGIPELLLLPLVGVLLALPRAEGGDCAFARPAGYRPAPYYPPTYYPPTLYPYPYGVPTNNDFAFGVGEEYRLEKFAKLVAEHYARLQQPPPAAVRAGQAVPAAIPAARAQAAPDSADRGSGWGSARPTPTGLPEGFAELVADKCQSCHVKGAKGSGRLLLPPDAAGLSELPEAVRDRMFRACSNRKMPKGGELTAEQLNLFDAFAELAAAANAKDNPAPAGKPLPK